MARFSVFVAIIMCSFALAFFALFSSCSAGLDQEKNLAESFQDFGAALITVFEAALGQFNIRELFGGEGLEESELICGRPAGILGAGIFIMVLYLVIVSILMMNLLIAILTTAHADVHANAEKEFRLARTKLIQQSSRSVVNGRVPPPLNLMTLAFGFIGDSIWEARQWFR